MMCGLNYSKIPKSIGLETESSLMGYLEKGIATGFQGPGAKTKTIKEGPFSSLI